MIACKELGKEFASKTEMFFELKANRELIVAQKKAQLKFSDPVQYFVKQILEGTGVEKALPDTPEVVGIGSTIYAIINTTNFYDSCGDVHLDGIWDNSIQDQVGKLYYVMNHDLKLGSVIAYPKDVKASVVPLKWSDIGQDYTGSMQALVYAVKLTEAANKDALNAIITKQDIQNSVRMGYIAMILCIDSTDDDYKQEKANFDKYIKVVANKDAAIEAGYFWAIVEAKIVKEGSACLFGANEATPILYADPAGAGQKSKEEQQESPPESSQPAAFDINKLLNIFPN